MKKIFRTILAVMVAVMMSFAIVAFTGCDPSDSRNNGVISSGTIDSIADTDFKALNLDATVGMGNQGTYNIGAKINLNGTADISVAAIGSGDNEGENFYEYVFMRGWKVYGAQGDEEIKDFTKEELVGLVDVKQAIEAVFAASMPEGVELPADVFEALELDELTEESLGAVNGVILSIANAADAVTESKGVITVDVNKLVYNIVSDAKTFLNGLKGTTTVGDILNNEIVKKYAKVFTELETPEDFIEEILESLKDLEDEQLPAEEAAIINQVKELFKKVTPDKKSSTYDYIVKLLSSQELVDLINSVMGMPQGLGLNQKLTDFTLNSIYTMITEGAVTDIEPVLTQIKQVIEAYTSGISATELKVTAEGQTLFAMSGTKFVYNYDKNGLNSQKLEMKLTLDGMVMTVDATLTYNKSAYANSEFATLPSKLPEIEDVEIGGGDDNNEYGGLTVAGHRFVCVDVDYDFDESGLTESDIQSLEQKINEMYVEYYIGSYLVFNNDGTYEGDAGLPVGVYEQYKELVFIAHDLAGLISDNYFVAFLEGSRFELIFEGYFYGVWNTITLTYELAD